MGLHSASLRVPRATPGSGQCVPRLAERLRLGVLTSQIPPELVDEVLERTGRVEQRRRVLPARAVVYFVLALCLFSSAESASAKLSPIQLYSGWFETFSNGSIRTTSDDELV